MKQYNFNISLSILNHLGRNLYRSFMTVLGEAISNSWDADANNVQKDDMHAILRIPRFTLYDGPNGESREVMLLGDNDVFFVAEGEEFDENPSIIMPDKPKIILP